MWPDCCTSLMRRYSFFFTGSTSLKRSQRNLEIDQMCKTPRTPEPSETEAPKTGSDVSLIPQTKPAPASSKERRHCKPDQTPAWKVILECATLIVTGVGIVVFYQKWKAADAANVLTATNFKAAQRAWVGTDLLKSRINIPTGSGVPIDWHIALQNYGYLPL